MKATGWTILIIFIVIVAMILLTIFSQFDLLQTRVDQGIGSSTEQEEFLGY